MARTKGARDKAKRKAKAPVKTTMRPAAATAPVATPTIGGERPPERPAIAPDDFKAAIAAELGKASELPGPDNVGSASCSPPVPAASFDPAALTLEGLANAWRLPFYGLARLLAWLRIAPDQEPIEAVGRKHARVMAKASMPIWEHYSRKYLDVHPDQAVNVSIGVTALDGIGIVPDLIDAIGQSRRRAARNAAAVQPPASAPTAHGGAVL